MLRDRRLRGEAAAEAERRRERAADVERLTAALRTDTGRFWSDLRRLLHERGIDPATTVVADEMPDEDCQILELVAADGSLYEVDYDDREYRPAPEPPRLTRFELLSENFGVPERWEDDGRFEAAFALARRGSPAP